MALMLEEDRDVGSEAKDNDVLGSRRSLIRSCDIVDYFRIGKVRFRPMQPHQTRRHSQLQFVICKRKDTMLGYLVALLPLYIFLWLPLSQIIYGTSKGSSHNQTIHLNNSLIASDEPLSCSPHNYNTFILSTEPLVIYIENFLSVEESKHLLDIR
jgi:hypothetical protein